MKSVKKEVRDSNFPFPGWFFKHHRAEVPDMSPVLRDLTSVLWIRVNATMIGVSSRIARAIFGRWLG